MDDRTQELSGGERRRVVRIAAGFFIFWALWLGLLGALRWTHPALDHGDPTTDANILNAGENFDREGMRRSLGIPALDTYRTATPQASGDEPDWYTTYPPGAYWVHQAVKGVGVGSLAGFRLVAIALAGAAVLLMFLFLWRLCGDPLPALAACVLYMTARPFLEFADNLHYISLSQVSLMATLYAWTRYEQAETARSSGGWLVVSALCFFADSWLTFEHALFVVAYMSVRVLWLRRPARLAAVALVALAPVVVMGIRILLNRAVLGSFDAVFALMRAKAGQRVGSSSTGTGMGALVDVWLPRLGWVSHAPDHPDAEFQLPLLALRVLIPLGALLVVSLAAWHLPGFRPVRRAIGAGALLVVCGLTWFVAMTEHAITHRFTVMLLLPGVAALAGALIAGGLMQRRVQPSGALIRHVGRGLALLVVVSWVAGVRSSFAFNRVVRGEPRVRTAVHRRDASLASMAQAGAALADVSRLRMWSHDAPAARAIGRPFDNPPHTFEVLEPGEALLVPLWSVEARAAAADAVGRLGLPDQLSPRVMPYVLFRAGRADADRCGVATVSGLVLERAAWRATVDGEGWVFMAAVSGPLDRLSREGGGGVVLEVRTRRGGGGEEGPESTIGRLSLGGPAWIGGMRSGSSVLLRLDVPREAMMGAGRVSLHALVRRRGAAGAEERSGWVVGAGGASGEGWVATPEAIIWANPPWMGPAVPPGAVER